MTSVFGGAQTVPQSTNQFTSSQTNQETNANTSQNQQASQNQMQTSSYAPNYMAQSTGNALWTNLGQFTSPGGVPGMQIAPLTPEQYGAIGGLTSGGMGIGSALLPMGGGFLTTGGGLMGQAGQGITGEDVAGFYNPMAANVTANLQDIFAQQNLANRLGATTAAGGTGSDRAAVAQGMLAQKQGLAAGQVYTDLYQKALQAAQQQKVQQLGAGAGIAGLGLPTIGAGIGGYQTALQGASVPQAQQQAINQALYQQQMGQYQDPYLRAQALGAGIPLLNMLGGTTTATGAGQTAQSGASATTGTANQIGSGINLGQGQITYPAPSMFSQLAGLGTLGLGAASMFSDRRDKTDIQRVGKDRTSGLPLFAFRYKGDPKHYPKVIGPMAQDVEKVYPGAVKEFQYGGEVSGDDLGGDGEEGYVGGSTDYYDEEDKPESKDKLFQEYSQRQQQQETAKKPWQRAQKTLAAMNTMQKSLKGFEANTNLRGPTFPAAPWAKMSPIQLGQFQGGGVVAPRGLPMPRPGAPSLGAYPQAANYPSLLRNVGAAMGPMRRGYPVIRQEGGRVSPSTAAEWGPGQTERQSYQRNLARQAMGPERWDTARSRVVTNPTGRPTTYPVGPTPSAIVQSNRSSGIVDRWEPAPGVYQEGGRTMTGDYAPVEDRRNEKMTAGEYWGLRSLRPWLAQQARRQQPSGQQIGGMPLVVKGDPLAESLGYNSIGGGYQEGGAVPTPQPRPAEAPQEAEAPEPTPATSEEALRAAPAGPEPAAPTPPATVPPGAEPAGMPRVGGIGGMFSGLFGGKGGGTGEERPSPALALMQAGLGMLAASGQRDARGLPMSPLGAVGLGGMAGIQTYQGQQQQMLKDRQRAIQEKNIQDLMRHRLELENIAKARLQATQGIGKPVTIQTMFGPRSAIQQPDGSFKDIETGETLGASAAATPASAEAGATPTAPPAEAATPAGAPEIDPSASPNPPQTEEQKQTAALALGGLSKFKTPNTVNRQLLKAMETTPQQFDFDAVRLAKGDTSVLQGRGTRQVAQMYAKAMRARANQWYIDQGLGPEEANAAKIEFAAMGAGARAIATREGNITTSLARAEKTADIVVAASDKVDRTKYPTLNKIIIAAKTQTGDENTVRYGLAMETFIRNYASAMGQGSSVLTDTSQRLIEKRLQEAYSKGQVRATIDQAKLEISRELEGTRNAMRYYLGTGSKEVLPQGTPESATTTAPAATKPDVRQNGHLYRWDPTEGKYKPVQ